MLFFHQPGPIPGPDRLGPGSTRWKGPGFKTLVIIATSIIKTFVTVDTTPIIVILL
jgi:hypothetical protein